MATITLTPGADVFALGTVGDLVTGTLANLTAIDVISAGNGSATDTLRLTTAGSISTAPGGNASGMSGFERIDLAVGSSTLLLTEAFLQSSYVGTASVGWVTVFSGGNDTIDASAATSANARIQVFAGGGTDTLLGGAGADNFRFLPADLTAADTVDGGAGTLDLITLEGAGALAANAFANVTNIERIMLHAGGNSLTLTETTVGSADGPLAVIGGAGDDVVDASSATTRLGFTAGTGDDTFTGGAGDDQINIALSALTSADRFDGGAGRDRIGFTGAGVITASMLSGLTSIETLSLSSAGDNDVTLGTNLATVNVAGGSGRDTVRTALATQYVSLGAGDDTLIVQANTVPTGTSYGKEGIDTIIASGRGTFVLGAGIVEFEKVLMTSGATLDLRTTTMDLEVTGSAEKDIFLVGAGDFVINGGADFDTLRLAADFMTVKLAGGAQWSGVGTLTLSNIEKVTALGLNANITGDAMSNELEGGAGDDIIDGGGANDIIRGGAGNDTLQGGTGNDIIAGNAGNDTIDGGTGTDTASYLTAPSGVVVSLTITGPQNTLGAGIDTLISIERLHGSDFNDQLTGNAQINTLIGEGGDDLLIGGGGADRIEAGPGNDRVRYLTTNDGSDTVLGFSAGGTDDRFEFLKSAFPLHNGWAAITLFTQGTGMVVPAAVNVLARTQAGLDNAAAVDAYAASAHPVAGGLLLLTQVAAGAKVQLWYDAYAAASGGTNTFLIATLPEITLITSFTNADFFGV
jgi:Ca2+-binding RTX toxin-like protein